MIIPIWYLVVSALFFFYALVINREDVAKEPYELYKLLGCAITWPISVPLDLVRYLVTR